MPTAQESLDAAGCPGFNQELQRYECDPVDNGDGSATCRTCGRVGSGWPNPSTPDSSMTYSERGLAHLDAVWKYERERADTLHAELLGAQLTIEKLENALAELTGNA